MKIGPYPEIPAAAGPTGVAKPGQPATARTGASAPAGAATAGTAVAGDTVTVSNLARALETRTANDGVDMERVAAVKAAIDNGTYKVNAEAIADRLLANAQEMLDRNRAS